MKYDIEKRQSAMGKWKYVWVARKGGRFATIDEAVKAAKQRNKEEESERWVE